jgi:RNA polymerase sigma factor (sigma-70 family)
MKRGAWHLAKRLHLALEGVDAPQVADAELLTRFLDQNSESAFSQLVERHAGLVWNVCRGSLASHVDAEDAFQATFLVLFQNARRIRQLSSLAAWLHGVAWRIARKINRTEVRRRLRERQQAQSETRCNAADHRETAEWMQTELARLPWHYRQPLLLCCVEGHSHGSAAEALGWPVGTVAGRLSRAKELLRSRLVRRGIAPALTTQAMLDLARAAVPAALLEKTLQLIPTGGTSKLALLAKGALGTMVLTKWLLAGVLCVGLSLAVGVGYSAWPGNSSAGPAAQANAPAVTSQKNAEDSDYQKIQGRWRYEKRNEVTDTLLWVQDLVFRGRKYAQITYSVEKNGELNQTRESDALEFVLDASKNPKRMELQELDIKKTKVSPIEVQVTEFVERLLFTYDLNGDTLTMVGAGKVLLRQDGQGGVVPDRNNPKAKFLTENDPDAVKMVYRRLPSASSPKNEPVDEEITRLLKEGEVAFVIRLEDPRYRGFCQPGDRVTVITRKPAAGAENRFKPSRILEDIEVLSSGLYPGEKEGATRVILRVTANQAAQLKTAQETGVLELLIMNRGRPFPEKIGSRESVKAKNQSDQAKTLLNKRERELLDERVAVTEDRFKMLWKNYQSGKITDQGATETILQAIKDRLQAKMEAFPGADQATANQFLQEAFNSAKQVETTAEARHQGESGRVKELEKRAKEGVVAQGTLDELRNRVQAKDQDRVLAKLVRLDYELRLLRLDKAKK